MTTTTNTTPQAEGAAILSHYFKSLARAAGLRWTELNDADILQACTLLGSDAVAAALPVVPPYGSNRTPERPAVRPAPQPARDPRNASAEENAAAKRILNQAAAAAGFETVKMQREGN